jgi:signal transduction protein with GAF and PtsI domain
MDTLTIEHIDLLHEIGSRIAAADPFHEVLARVVDFGVALARSDSCFIYVVEGDDLVLRASKNAHKESIDSLRLKIGQGITGWVAEHQEHVAISEGAHRDPRFKAFQELPEDRFEAFLSVPILCRGRLVGVINLQHRSPHTYSPRVIRLISTVGFLVGAEIEMARLETENSRLSEKLETRKVVERAKGIIQREMGFTEEQAYLALQHQSRQKRKSMREIAEAILLSEELRRGVRAS